MPIKYKSREQLLQENKDLQKRIDLLEEKMSKKVNLGNEAFKEVERSRLRFKLGTHGSKHQ